MPPFAIMPRTFLHHESLQQAVRQARLSRWVFVEAREPKMDGTSKLLTVLVGGKGTHFCFQQTASCSTSAKSNQGIYVDCPGQKPRSCESRQHGWMVSRSSIPSFSVRCECCKHEDSPVVVVVIVVFVCRGPTQRVLCANGGSWYSTYNGLQTATIFPHG